jgi:hypothetical protein
MKLFPTDSSKYLEQNESSWIFHLLSRMKTFSWSNWFLVKGFFLCTMFYKSSKDLEICSTSVADNLKQYCLMCLYRALRVIFPYITILLSLRILMKYFHESSIITLPSLDHVNCDDISRNIFFLNNFGPPDKRVSIFVGIFFEYFLTFFRFQCAVWTWYISLEIQFYTVGLLVLMLSRHAIKFAWMIFIGFFISTLFTSIAMDVNNQHHEMSKIT